MMVCACDNPNSRSCPRTMQGIVMDAVQTLTQALQDNPCSQPVFLHLRLWSRSRFARFLCFTLPYRSLSAPVRSMETLGSDRGMEVFVEAQVRPSSMTDSGTAVHSVSVHCLLSADRQPPNLATPLCSRNIYECCLERLLWLVWYSC